MTTLEDLPNTILRALDGLLSSLRPESLGENRFRVHSEANRFGRVFGGQMVAQAMQAAATTVGDTPPIRCTPTSSSRAIPIIRSTSRSTGFATAVRWRHVASPSRRQANRC